jgi:mannose-6-phosphate isomerase-like protein (cupin superfamily)
MSTYKKFIKKGVVQPLEKVPFHHKAPLKRILMQSEDTFPDIKTILPGSNFHIAAHIITKLPKKIPKYVEPHAHNCDEINLILSETGNLKYKINLGNEEYIVTSPATVYIPKRVKHSAQVISGKGIYVCILMSQSYKKSLIRK